MKEQEALQLGEWFYRKLMEDERDGAGRTESPWPVEPAPAQDLEERWKRWIETIDR